MNIIQLSTSSCQTIYRVDQYKILLWIITGGQPAMSFDDHTFTERFPITDTRWAVEHTEWKRLNRYPHQDPKAMQGPTFDVLPEGRKTLVDFVAKNAPLLELREKRFGMLPDIEAFMHRSIFCKNNIRSKRVHDAEERTYVTFKAELRNFRFGPVTASSASYSGRCEDKIASLAPEWWKRYAAFVSPLCDANRGSYEKLTEEEFKQLCDLLTEGIATNSLA